MSFTIEERFWNKVDTSTGYTGCWNWLASKYRGYGQFWDARRLVPAHRFALELYTGKPISEELTVDHLCSNPSCVNPKHLQAITMRDNCLLGSKAQNTHCPKGHPFEGRNVIWFKTSRSCRICKQHCDRRQWVKHGKRYRAKKRIQYLRDKDKILAKQRAYYEANKEKILARQRAYQKLRSAGKSR